MKSKWNDVKEQLDKVTEWAKQGLIDTQIAHNLGIGEKTFYEYKNKHPQFEQALKKGKAIADVEVENALYKRAIGYDYQEKVYEPLKGDTDKLRVVKVNEKHMPPDTTAQIFWLKNRKPADWRDKREIEANKEELSKVDKLLDRIKKESDNN